ncbi:MAG: hypothetical protein JST08_21905 [Actinobacteria bacterium]|nr:hypothetical protein [Actinomycetota bacterium]
MARTTATVLVTTLLVLAAFATAAIAAAPSAAWKVLAATGPTNLPPRQSETQRVTVEAEGGQFTLAFTIEGEGTLGFGSGAAFTTTGSSGVSVLSPRGVFQPGMVVSSANFPVGTTITAVSGSQLTLSNAATAPGLTLLRAASKEVTNVSTSTGQFHPGDPISGAGIPTGTTIVSVVGSTVTLSAFPTESGSVALKSTETTTPISAGASAPDVQNALEALPELSAVGAIAVEGGPGGDVEHPWFVHFGGPFLLQDVPQLAVDGTALVGEHANTYVRTVVPGGDGTGKIAVYPTNIGGLATSGTVTVEVGPLPPGVVISGPGQGSGWNCLGGAGESMAICTSTVSLGAVGTTFQAQQGTVVELPIEIESAAPFRASAPVTVSGGGGGSAAVQMPIVVSPEEAEAGIQAFWAGAFEANGEPSTQAGAHPASAVTNFAVNTVRAPSGEIIPAGDIKDVVVDLPPGFLGNPLVTPRCPQDNLVAPTDVKESAICGDQQAVGSFGPVIERFGHPPNGLVRLFNDHPAIGTAAEFSGSVLFPVQSLVGSIRSTDDFGVRILAPQAPTYYKIFGAFAALQGMPSGAEGKAFLTNPTDCSVQREEAGRGQGPATRIEARTYQSATLSSMKDPLPVITGCDALTEAWLGQGPQPQNEEPSFSFQPTTDQASSPTGATATLHIPQAALTDPGKLAASHLKKTVVTLPKGLSVNPSSAAGLEACSEAQVGYVGNAFLSPNPTRFDEKPVTCPDGSKLGTFQVKTPLLEEELEGTIYLAAQEENPFNSLIALYLVVESERFGITLKLPGEVRPDLATGQLTATFDNNPQLPFEDLTLHFRGGGPRSTLATPETCGHFETTGSLEPWSAEHGEALPIQEAGFSTSGACASSEESRPFGPTFEAGTIGTQAGAYSPLVIKVDRKDGEQELRRLNFTLPKGLTGKLASIPYCPEGAIKEAEGKSGKAEQASPSCSAASQIGTVDTAAGVGSAPIHVAGKVYLAGPYQGAPLSSVVVTPAVAGPFDLGDVVIRAPLFVDPETAQITAQSDPIPTILKGIPLKVRSVVVNLDRSGFTLNPTSCNPMSVSAAIEGSNGATAKPTNRFQVGGCTSLKFKPQLELSLKGSTKHTGHPALKAVLTYPKQGAYANIARAQVNLPHSEFIDQGNLDKTCTKPVLLEGKCPKRSIYGKAKAWTPLLDAPLEGPVYLVGGYGYKLPALVAELNGQIRVVLKGKVDSGPNKGIRNTFEAVPDAPVSRFVLEMKGGKKYGLLENSENLCSKSQRAIARFTAQDGKVLQVKPLIANQCGKKKGKTKKK